MNKNDSQPQEREKEKYTTKQLMDMIEEQELDENALIACFIELKKLSEECQQP